MDAESKHPFGQPKALWKKVWFQRTSFPTFTTQNEGGISIMLIIPVKEGESIDKALKKFKKKFERTGVVKELRAAGEKI